MRLANPFPELSSVPVRIATHRATTEVLAAVASAVERRVYSQQRGSARLLRLRGKVTGTAVSLRAQTYVIPGVPARGLRLSLDAEVVSRPHGSELRGSISAPVPSSTVRLLLGWLLIMALFGAIVHPLLLIGYAVMVPLLALVWASMLRENQRSALAGSDDLVVFLQSILDGTADADIGLRSRGA